MSIQDNAASRLDLAQGKLKQLGSLAAWKLDFIERLGQAVVESVQTEVTQHPWHFDIDQRTRLEELSDEDVLKLAFGEYFDVIEEWEMNDFYPQDQDIEHTKGVVRDVCNGNMAKETQALAEALDEDADDFIDALQEDDDLSPQELGIGEFSRKYIWTGTRQAVCSIGEVALDPAVGGLDDKALFVALRTLRIPLDDYLRAATVAIDDLAPDGEMDDQHIAAFGLEHVDVDSAEGASSTWAEHYANRVTLWGARFASREGVRLDEYDQPPVISPEHLIGLALQFKGRTDLYFHVIIDKDTIADVGRRAACHDLKTDKQEPDFHIEFMSGYIAGDKDSGDELPYGIEIKEPLLVMADAFSIISDQCDKRTGDVVAMTPENETWTHLYAILNAKGGPHNAEDLDLVAHADVIQQARECLQSASWWAGQHAITRVPQAQHPAIAEVVASKPSAQDRVVMARRIREEFESMDAGGDAPLDKPSHLATIRRLLPWLTQESIQEADKGYPNTLFEKSCECVMPLDIVEHLKSLVVDRALSDTAMVDSPSRIDTDCTLNASNALTRLVRRCHTLANGPPTQRLQLGLELCFQLCDMGAVIPAEHCLLNGASALSQCLLIDNSKLMNALMQGVQSAFGQEVHDRIAEGLCVSALFGYRTHSVASLLERGVDLDAPAIQSAFNTIRSRNQSQSYAGDERPEKLGGLENLFRAHRARLSAREALTSLSLQL